MSKQSQPGRKSYLARLTFSLLFLALSVGLFLNRQYLVDLYNFQTFQPSATMRSIVEKSQLSERSKFYLYASQPQLYGRDLFNSHCNQLAEHTAVLGCYDGRNIYLFDVTDPRLGGIEEVTAAHEMLHAAYERLSSAEKTRVDNLLEQAYESTADQKLRELVALYDRTEPGQRLNELHSLLGTQVGVLPAELENYYKKYFTDRQLIVGFYNKYESVFADIAARQDALVAEIEALNGQISEQIDSYNREAESLNAAVKEFNASANSGKFTSQSQFNAERSALVARQSALNAKRDEINNQIALYNTKRQELQDLNGQAQSLNQSINSLAPVQGL